MGASRLLTSSKLPAITFTAHWVVTRGTHPHRPPPCSFVSDHGLWKLFPIHSHYAEAGVWAVLERLSTGDHRRAWKDRPKYLWRSHQSSTPVLQRSRASQQLVDLIMLRFMAEHHVTSRNSGKFPSSRWLFDVPI